jgi:hypothetical protein
MVPKSQSSAGPDLWGQGQAELESSRPSQKSEEVTGKMDEAGALQRTLVPDRLPTSQLHTCLLCDLGPIAHHFCASVYLAWRCLLIQGHTLGAGPGKS